MKTAAVITISDKGARGERVDTSGPALCRMLEEAGYRIQYTHIIPDDLEGIKAELIKCADQLQTALVLTTGGTGFSPRDITPEATLAVIERETRGIPEAMRSASMQITPKGCLSRSVAGIRGGTLIINLPGSEKASKENLAAVLPVLNHGLDMLASAGSADCGTPVKREASVPEIVQKYPDPNLEKPSMDQWLQEAKKAIDADKVGMYLVHNGIVRGTAKDFVRNRAEGTRPVKSLSFSYDEDKVLAAVEETKQKEGIYFVRAWLNRGELSVGEDIMYVMIGGDIRPRVTEALDFLVGKIKTECVTETEIFE